MRRPTTRSYPTRSNRSSQVASTASIHQPASSSASLRARQPVPRSHRRRTAECGRPHGGRRQRARCSDGVRRHRTPRRFAAGLQPRVVPRHRIPGPAVHTTQAAPPSRRRGDREASRRHRRRRTAALAALLAGTCSRAGVALLDQGGRDRRGPGIPRRRPLPPWSERWRLGDTAARSKQAERARYVEHLGDLHYVSGNATKRPHRCYRLADVARSMPSTTSASCESSASQRNVGARPSRSLRWLRRVADVIPPRSNARVEWLAERAKRRTCRRPLFRSATGDDDRCLALARACCTRRCRGDRRQSRDRALALERSLHSVVYGECPTPNMSVNLRSRRTGPRGPRGDARTLINLGVEAYFDSDWETASTRYLEALQLADRSGGVVLAATAAINGAEILSDQGVVHASDRAVRWRSAELRGGRVSARCRSHHALLGRRPDVARRSRRGPDPVRCRGEDGNLTELGMSEWVDDLDTRAIEADVLAGEPDFERIQALSERLGTGHPFALRVDRTRALERFVAGEATSARTSLRTS